MYEPGITVEVLDHVFGQLRERIVPLVKRNIGVAKEIKDKCFIGTFFKRKTKTLH